MLTGASVAVACVVVAVVLSLPQAANSTSKVLSSKEMSHDLLGSVGAQFIAPSWLTVSGMFLIVWEEGAINCAPTGGL